VRLDDFASMASDYHEMVKYKKPLSRDSRLTQFEAAELVPAYLKQRYGMPMSPVNLVEGELETTMRQRLEKIIATYHFD
jgi:hypothetical protein